MFERSTVPYCANCGTQELGDRKFCTICGARSMSATNISTQLSYSPTDGGVEARPAGLAHFWWRVLSYTMDSLLLGLFVAGPLRLSHQTFYLSAVIQIVAAFLYGALFIGYGNGQTLGMRVVRLRCVRADDRGRVEPRRAFRRALGYCALLVIGSVYHFHIIQHPTSQQSVENGKQSLIFFSLAVPHYLDLLWVAWDKKNQSLHDKFAQTIVVREPKVLN
ncbi:MAG TPA: RDD family protein [Acidimicrobiales bacterium]